MRFSSFCGYLGLAGLSVSTFVLTNQAISGAQRVRAAKQTAREADVAVPSYSSYTPSRDTSKRVAPPVYATEVVRDGWSAGSLEVTRLSEVPGGVAVEAAGALSNGIEDRQFVWTLTALSRDGSRTILKRRYDHQVGLSRVGTIERLTFHETVELPPGEYFVAVSIQEVPPAGLQALDDPAMAKSMTMTGDGQYIIIH